MKKKGEGRVSKFTVERFLSRSADKIRRGIVYSVNIFVYRKNLCFRGLYHDYQSKLFYITVPNFFVEEPFCAVLQKFSGGEKVHEREGGGASIEIYRRRFFVSKRRQNLQGNLLFCQYFRVSKKFML